MAKAKKVVKSPDASEGDRKERQGTPIPKYGEPGWAAQTTAMPPSSTRAHEAVLLVLARHPESLVNHSGRYFSVQEIADFGKNEPQGIRDRGTVGKILRELLQYHLVKQEHGPKGGYAIDNKGLQHLQSCNII